MNKLSGSRILVLGGSGFIGKNLCRALVHQQAVVRCFSIDDPFANGFLNDLKGKIEWVQGDFNDTHTIQQAIQNIDVIFHLICTTLPESSNKDPLFDLSSNVLPTLGLLDLIKEPAVKKVVFVSSGGTIYGIPDRVPIPEGHVNQPICGYGIHKLMIEKYLYLYHQLYDLDYRILRLSNPYGKNQISNCPQGVIGNFIYKALHGYQLDIWGDGTVVRDYIYIDDAISAFIKILNYTGSHRIFNIGSGEGYSLLDIISLIEEITGTKLKVNFHPSRSVDLPINVLDISRAQSELSWKTRTTLKTGIEHLFEYGNTLLYKAQVAN